MRRSSDLPDGAAEVGIELGLIGLRVLAGRRLRWRHRRAGIVAVASDTDPDAGVAAVWMERGTGPLNGIEEICCYERVSGSWRYRGGGGSNSTSFTPGQRRPAVETGPGSMLTHLGSCSVRSSADRAAQGDQLDPSRAGWVAAETFRVAAEVTRLQVGPRQVEIPDHGHVVVAWKAPPADRPRRPPIAALGTDGAILSELGPDSHLDTRTWDAINKAIDDLPNSSQV